MLFGSLGWLFVCFVVWISIRIIVALNCSEEVSDRMFIFDIAFICLVFAIIYFNDDVQFLLW